MHAKWGKAVTTLTTKDWKYLGISDGRPQLLTMITDYGE